MSLTSRVNVDVLLYLFKFLNSTDQFNLVLSGVLQGFENTSYSQRYLLNNIYAYNLRNFHSFRNEGICIELKYRSQKIVIGYGGI